MIKITKTRNELCVDDDNCVEVQDPVTDWLIRSMRTAQTGTIKLDIEGTPSLKIEIVNYGNNIMVDLLQPLFSRTADDEVGLYDKLKLAKEFAKSLPITV